MLFQMDWKDREWAICDGRERSYTFKVCKEISGHSDERPEEESLDVRVGDCIH